MKPDTVQVGRSITGDGWVFVEPSEGFGEAVWGNEASVKRKVIMRDEKRGLLRRRKVEVKLFGGGVAGKWWMDVRDELAYVGGADG